MEDRAPQSSRQEWESEFIAFSKLFDFYERLNSVCRPQGRGMTDYERLSFIFLLSVKQQIVPVVSLMLRARTVDAMTLTRRAIEATAFANRIWKYPNLLEVYVRGYPNVNSGTDHRQWQPSADYLKQFSINKIFSDLGEVGQNLRTMYAIVCMRASHPGIGLLQDLRSHEGGLFLHSHETDPRKLGQIWVVLCGVFFDCWKVFLRVLRSLGNSQNIRILEDEIMQWREISWMSFQYRPDEPNLPSSELL